MSTALRTPPPAARAAAILGVYAAAFTMAAPFVWMILTSLKPDGEALNGRLLPTAWNWGSYAEAMRAARLDRFFATSLLAAGLTTLLAGFFNALAGYVFAKMRFAGKRPAFGAVIATMLLPMQVFFIFAYLIAARLGFIDNIQALVVPFLASGFGIFYMRQAVASVPDSLLEAGRLDGMGDLDLFWTVVMPSVKPATAALAVFSFVNSWNNFFWPLVVCDRDESKTLTVAVAELAAGIYVQSWPVRMAAATIITVPLLVVFLFFQRAFVRGVAASGLKE